MIATDLVIAANVVGIVLAILCLYVWYWTPRNRNRRDDDEGT